MKAVLAYLNSIDMKKPNYDIRYCPADTPIGRIFVAASSLGLTDAVIRGKEDDFLLRLELKYSQSPRKDKAFFSGFVKRLEAYFNGDNVSFTDFPLDVRGTDFEIKVWSALKNVPYGAVISYAALALRAGFPNAARPAGSACGKNPLPIIIPCHRVLPASGKLGNYTGGADIKKALLRIEGVVF